MFGATTYDHTLNVWRFTESRGATFREVVRSWTKTISDIRMKVQATRERREDVGPGEIVGGEYNAYGSAHHDIREGDVLELTAGPESPRTLKVDSAYRPMSHHAELVLVPFTGELP